jgi:hypothetical protein
LTLKAVMALLYRPMPTLSFGSGFTSGSGSKVNER